MAEHNVLGEWGERVAREYLLRLGYAIGAENTRIGKAEIDFIAIKDDRIVFVEVKTRADTAFGLPREAVGVRKQRRIRAAAAYYLAMHDLDCPVRFDVAEVYTEESPGELRGRVEYLEAAFD